MDVTQLGVLAGISVVLEDMKNKLVDCLHFEQYRPGFFGPWNGLVLDWFSFPQLNLD